MKMKHYTIYISLHVLSCINLVEAYKQYNVLRNGETVLKTVQNYLFPNVFFLYIKSTFFFFFYALDAM